MPSQAAWAFDGSKNFVTAAHVQLRGGVDMPRSNQLEVTVRDVPEADKGRLTDWQVMLLGLLSASLSFTLCGTPVTLCPTGLTSWTLFFCVHMWLLLAC